MNHMDMQDLLSRMLGTLVKGFFYNLVLTYLLTYSMVQSPS